MGGRTCTGAIPFTTDASPREKLVWLLITVKQYVLYMLACVAVALYVLTPVAQRGAHGHEGVGVLPRLRLAARCQQRQRPGRQCVGQVQAGGGGQQRAGAGGNLRWTGGRAKSITLRHTRACVLWSGSR